ncbi:MAG: hypothetical protein GF383_04415 [Candidatus Lokiarchaeota archaeon]|nr:hypothetical protein [Candidatus Lokiarchaeota archaeon]MBD3339033.1 hypothetical protein [Candidatus Lokiarchaeota archaeon]
MIDPLNFLNGLFSLIIVITSTIVGIIITLKYKSTGDNTFVLIGISWIGIICPWWPSAISFLLILFTGTGLSPHFYILIGNLLVPWFVLIYVLGISKMVYKEKRKPVVIVFFIIAILYDIYLIYYLVVDYTVIGELTGFFDIQYKAGLMILLMFYMGVVLVHGFMVIRDAMKSKKPYLKLKGKFLIFAYLFYGVGGVLDAIVPLTTWTIILTRTILVLCSIFFYLGFLMPSFVSKSILKEHYA